jgi:hypothetical protein
MRKAEKQDERMRGKLSVNNIKRAPNESSEENCLALRGKPNSESFLEMIQLGFASAESVV